MRATSRHHYRITRHTLYNTCCTYDTVRSGPPTLPTGPMLRMMCWRQWRTSVSGACFAKALSAPFAPSVKHVVAALLMKFFICLLRIACRSRYLYAEAHSLGTTAKAQRLTLLSASVVVMVRMVPGHFPFRWAPSRE